MKTTLPVRPYYLQSEGLLFQFILHEFLRICTLLKEPPKPPLFAKLMGTDNFYLDSPTFSWGRDGALKKLHTYISLLLIHFPEQNNMEDPLLNDLLGTTHKACLSVLKCKALFERDKIAFDKEYGQLKKLLKKIGDLLPKRIVLYQKNESVLYFLLERQEMFRFLYGAPLVGTLLQSLFPGGVREAGAYIVTKYKQRGYLHLIPNIEQQLLAVEQSLL